MKTFKSLALVALISIGAVAPVAAMSIPASFGSRISSSILSALNPIKNSLGKLQMPALRLPSNVVARMESGTDKWYAAKGKMGQYMRSNVYQPVKNSFAEIQMPAFKVPTFKMPNVSEKMTAAKNVVSTKLSNGKANVAWYVKDRAQTCKEIAATLKAHPTTRFLTNARMKELGKESLYTVKFSDGIRYNIAGKHEFVPFRSTVIKDAVKGRIGTIVNSTTQFVSNVAAHVSRNAKNAQCFVSTKCDQLSNRFAIAKSKTLAYINSFKKRPKNISEKAAVTPNTSFFIVRNEVPNIGKNGEQVPFSIIEGTFKGYSPVHSGTVITPL